MPNRPAVSLVEVLVATVLLAVGAAGTVAALAAAARLRLVASMRESAVATAESRLAWFEARGCATPDTTIEAAPPDGERWTVRHDSLSVLLAGRAERRMGERIVRVPLTVRRECR